MSTVVLLAAAAVACTLCGTAFGVEASDDTSFAEAVAEPISAKSDGAPLVEVFAEPAVVQLPAEAYDLAGPDPVEPVLADDAIAPLATQAQIFTAQAAFADVLSGAATPYYPAGSLHGGVEAARFAVHDLNSDGIPELFIDRTETMYSPQLFAYRNGRVEYVDWLNGTAAVIYSNGVVKETTGRMPAGPLTTYRKAGASANFTLSTVYEYTTLPTAGSGTYVEGRDANAPRVAKSAIDAKAAAILGNARQVSLTWRQNTASNREVLSMVSFGTPTGFTDVAANAWYAGSVVAVSDAGLMTGSGNKFRPGDGMKRSELASVLWRATFDGSEFTYDANATSADGMPDTKSAQWYTAAANWAVHAGVINGAEVAGERRFRPDAALDRQTFAAILANYAGVGSGQSTAALSRVADGGKVANWARPGVAWALSFGVMSGRERDGERWADPISPVTRAEAAAMIANAMSAGLLEPAARDQLDRERDYQGRFARTASLSGTFTVGTGSSPDAFGAYTRSGSLSSDALTINGRIVNESTRTAVGPAELVFRVNDSTTFELAVWTNRSRLARMSGVVRFEDSDGDGWGWAVIRRTAAEVNDALRGSARGPSWSLVVRNGLVVSGTWMVD